MASHLRFKRFLFVFFFSLPNFQRSDKRKCRNFSIANIFQVRNQISRSFYQLLVAKIFYGSFVVDFDGSSLFIWWVFNGMKRMKKEWEKKIID